MWMKIATLMIMTVITLMRRIAEVIITILLRRIFLKSTDMVIRLVYLPIYNS